MTFWDQRAMPVWRRRLPLMRRDPMPVLPSGPTHEPVAEEGEESSEHLRLSEPPTLVRKNALGGGSELARFGQMVGASPAMRTLFALLERAAASEATVLIEGETGTGKEVSAEAIHRESRRKNGPFVVVDCGAIPPQLLES
jgi:transcriptional regulator with PAS, ATPase and Fis domain